MRIIADTLLWILRYYYAKCYCSMTLGTNQWWISNSNPVRQTVTVWVPLSRFYKWQCGSSKSSPPRLGRRKCQIIRCNRWYLSLSRLLPSKGRQYHCHCYGIKAKQKVFRLTNHVTVGHLFIYKPIISAFLPKQCTKGLPVLLIFVVLGFIFISSVFLTENINARRVNAGVIRALQLKE